MSDHAQTFAFNAGAAEAGKRITELEAEVARLRELIAERDRVESDRTPNYTQDIEWVVSEGLRPSGGRMHRGRSE